MYSGFGGNNRGGAAAAFDEGEIANARRIDLGSGTYTTAPAVVPPYARGLAQGTLQNAPLAGSRESGLDPVLPAAPSPRTAAAASARAAAPCKDKDKDKDDPNQTCSGGACANGAGGGRRWAKWAFIAVLVLLVLALMLGGAWWLQRRST